MGGDSGAFSDLARLAARRLYAVARLILHDEANAEDATQEALVIAWRDLSALRDPDCFEAWLHRVLVRTCYREAHRLRRRIEVEGQIRPLDAERDPGEQSAINDEVERGFARLSTEHRTVLVLHHYLGLTFPEIAETLSIPVGTAKSRLHRATTAMRDALTNEGSIGPAHRGQVA